MYRNVSTTASHILFSLSLHIHTGTFPDELYHRLFSFKFFAFKGNNFDVDKKTIKGVFINEFNNIKDQTSIELSGRGLTGMSKLTSSDHS